MATTVTLALGSGGARGYAHIGVIEELERRGYQIVGVAGSSMGSVVGAAYAAGALPAYTEWVRGLRGRDVIRELDPSFTTAGVIRAERVLTHVVDIVGDQLIEELPIPFTAMAVDLLAGRQIWLDHGRISAAIRASIAIPGLLTPAEVDGRVLVDGGVMCPVPVEAAATVTADVLVAVSLQGFRQDGAPEPRPARSRMFQSMWMSLEAAEMALAAATIAAHPPDVLIEVPKDACRTLDFHRADEMIELGRRLAVDALDAAGPVSLRSPDGGFVGAGTGSR